MFRQRLLSSVSFPEDPNICSITSDDGSGTGDPGGSSGAPSGPDPGSGSGSDSDPSGFEQAEPSPSIDLDSTDPAVIYSDQFPRNRKLSRAQLAAVMRYNPLEDAPPLAPPAQPPAVRTPAQAPTVAPTATAIPAGYQLPPGYKQLANGRFHDASGRYVAHNRIPWQRKGSAQPAPTPAQPAHVPVPAPGADQVQQLLAGFQQIIDERPGPVAAEPTAPAAPRYLYGPQGAKPFIQIPPQIFQAIESDDPNARMQGIAALANGIANTVATDMIAMMRGLRTDIMENHVPTAIKRHTTETSARTAFYSRYPQLRKPELSQLISNLSKVVGAEWASAGYDWRGPGGGPSEQFMDAVAQRYMVTVGLSELPSGTVAQPAVAPAYQPPVGGTPTATPVYSPQPAAGTPGGTPPYYPPRGARPPAESPNTAKSGEILKVINFR